MQELLPKDWVPASVRHGAKPTVATAANQHTTHSISKLNIKKKAHTVVHGIKSLPLVVSLHDTIKPHHAPGCLDPDARNDVHNVRRSLLKEYYPDTEIADSSSPSIQKRAVRMALHEERERQRQQQKSSETEPLLPSSSTSTSYSSSSSLSAPMEHGDRAPFTSEEDLPDQGDGDISLPLEILYRIALYINAAKAANKIESSFVSVTTNSLDTLVNTLTAFERIVHTPIPKAYNIHL